MSNSWERTTRNPSIGGGLRERRAIDNAERIRISQEMKGSNPQKIYPYMKNITGFDYFVKRQPLTKVQNCLKNVIKFLRIAK